MIRRLEKTITLGDDADATIVTVREITPGQATHFHKAVLGASTESVHTLPGVADLIVGDPEVKLQLLEQCTSLGAEVHELGGSAFLTLWAAFEEVNASFLSVLMSRLKRGAAEVAALEAAKASPPNQSPGA